METVHFGQIEVNAEAAIEIAGGIIPFADARKYVLLHDDQEAPFHWLQSLDVPALAFVCAPVRALFADQEELIRREAPLTDEERERGEILTIIVLAEEAAAATANLLAPVIVDRARGTGRQVIRDGDVRLCRVPIGAGEECHAGAHSAGQ